VSNDLSIHHYYVDEAGDLTFFDRKGRIIVGHEGVSRFFLIGVAYLPDPGSCERALDILRASLLADPYFKDVPSMQKCAGKTALCFHAKDDVPEVRREVFKLLPTLGARVQVALRRKYDLALAAHRIHAQSGQKLRADAIYDDLVARVFRNLLHKADENRITFARRGKSIREDALYRAIANADKGSASKQRSDAKRATYIQAAYPSESAGLQVVDYYLWALQRLFERREDRFFGLLANDFRLVMDLDDTRRREYGEWYSASNPLVLTKIKPCLD
jgi:hypothetical protein